MRWRYHLPRGQGEERWVRLPHVQRQASLIRAARAAVRAGAILRSAEPYPGWATGAHSRDGKFWPCPRGTQGARPAWIWTGDIAD